MSSVDTHAVFLPASRGRAATRAVLWSVPALLLGAAVAVIYSRLHFVPTAVSNRLVDYSIAVASLPLAAAALVCAWRTLRYLLLVVWPQPVGFFADGQRLIVRLGPFGAREFRADALDVRYPFEQSGDSEDGGFEAYLPEEEQMARLLPRIAHRAESVPLNRTLLHFAAADEPQAAAALRPAIESWRKLHDGGEAAAKPV